MKLRAQRARWTILAVLILLVAACGDGTGDPDVDSTEAPTTTDAPTTTEPSTETTEAPTETTVAPMETETLRLALFPALDYAPVFVGLDQGIFEAHGIDLQIQEVFTGSGLMSAVTSGQFDIATNSATGGVTGIVNGLPVKMLATTSLQPPEGYVEILVAADSEIEDFADLEGTTIATINLQGRFHLGALYAVEQAGGDWTTVESLPMSPVDEPAALAAGRVDAIMLQEPFLTQTKQQHDFRSLGSPYSLFGYDLPAGAFYSSNETLEQKGDLIRRFLDAYQEAADLVSEDIELAIQIIPTFTDLDEETVREITLPIWDTTFTETDLNTMMQSMADYGWIEYLPSFSQVVWTDR